MPDPTVPAVTIPLSAARASAHDVHKNIDVPTYPLAEWIALNWWSALAPTARRDGHGLRLLGAGDGFPWPDLTLRPGPGYVGASLRRLDRDPFVVRFLSSVEAILDAESTAGELARFIDATVRRLDEAHITGTPLQDEWNAITATDEPERDFCLVAAALGFDPYDIGPDQTRAVLSLGSSMGSELLRLDLAGSVDVGALPAALEGYS